MPAGVSAYVPLANTTLSSAAASVTFSSISQAYRDLVLVIQSATSTNYQQYKLNFNSDSGANYFQVLAQGDGAAVVRSRTLSGNQIYLNYDNAVEASINMTMNINIMDYSSTDKHKSSLVRSNAPTGTYPGVEMYANRWANTSAITTLVVSLTGGSMNAGSTFALYGVSA
jgi:hypothetical protein